MTNFNQTVELHNLNHIARFDLYTQLCVGKSVLHIGCADFPFEEHLNLHLHLNKVCDKLYGSDTNIDGLITLIEHGVDGLTLAPHLFYDKVDLVLVPEVIEHVPDLAAFFKELDKIDTEKYVITAPCAVQCGINGHFSRGVKHTFHEVVHPEHLCWYSPYTLVNTIKTHTDWEIEQVFWNNGISVGVICQK